MLNATPYARRPHRGPPTVALELTAEQRAEVEAVLRWPSCPQAVARRAQALLFFADSVPACDVARLLGVDERTVFKWKTRFDHPDPVSRLKDGPRTGRPRSLFRPPTAPA